MTILLVNLYINGIKRCTALFKAFYEISQEYNIDFDTIGVNGNYDFISNNSIDFNELSDDLFSDKIVAIQIVKNPTRNNKPIPVFKNDSTIYINDVLPNQNKREIGQI